MDMFIQQVLISFVTNPTYVIISISALLLSILFLVLAQQARIATATKVFLIYAHLSLLLVPLTLLAYNTGCQVPVYDCTTKTLIYSMPVLLGGSLLGAALFGAFIIPRLYISSSKTVRINKGYLVSLLRREATRLRIKVPRLHALDDAVPKAFSLLNNTIVVSIGLLDILSRKEQEAVVLHELHHIKKRSSAIKLSALLARAVSPLAHFGSVSAMITREENAADAFAIRTQRTSKHILSAKKKMKEFSRAASLP